MVYDFGFALKGRSLERKLLIFLNTILARIALPFMLASSHLFSSPLKYNTIIYE